MKEQGGDEDDIEAAGGGDEDEVGILRAMEMEEITNGRARRAMEFEAANENAELQAIFDAEDEYSLQQW